MSPQKRKKESIASVKGMHDLLPDDHAYWEKIREVVLDVAKFYNFGYLETPIVEPAELFERTVGESSDIVRKEMYTFRTRGGDPVALRPEGTAPAARAYIEHGCASLPQPVKVFYWGPMFRYESPQKGRYRQHHQFGFEMLGIDDALGDAEVLQIAFAILGEVGLKNLMAEVNTIGDKDDRVRYRSALKDHFRPHIRKQCSDCRERFRENPLRLLDCKQETCQEFIANAPTAIDYVGEPAKEHFKLFLEFLDEAQIPYMLNPYLVRGLDYYTRTVFEVFLEAKAALEAGEPRPDESGREEPPRIALLGGGRYDELIKILGGRETPAVGFAAGIERIVEVMKREKTRLPKRAEPKIFLVQLGELAKKKGLVLLEEFRRAGIPVAESLGKHSIRSQLKIADKLEAKLALILGQKEALGEEIIVRDMKSGIQETVPLSKLINEIKRRLKGGN